MKIEVQSFKIMKITPNKQNKKKKKQMNDEEEQKVVELKEFVYENVE